jgi:hypothetical protein
MTDAISFGALVGLMVAGTDAPDAVRGEIRSVGDGAERRYRVWRRGNLVRAEDLDGTVRTIVGAEARWHRDEDTGAMSVHRHERHADVVFTGSPVGGLDVGGPRPSWQRWEGTDFTRPTGPVTAAEFLGRPTFAVDLAPPAHKPHPMQLIVDAATGLVLRAANAAFNWAEEWVEVEIGASLPDELFVWTGPAEQVPSHEEQVGEVEGELRERRDWLRARGIDRFELPMQPEVMLHKWDDATGAFYASLDFPVGAALIRRPRSGEPWPEPDTTNYPHARRWSDDRWDWFLAGDWPIADDDFARLRTRLAAAT